MSTCPHCWIEWANDRDYIAHRFHELANWFTDHGDHELAARYQTKDPDDYILGPDRQITARDPRTCEQQASDDHYEGVARAAGARTYTRTDGTTWTNPDLDGAA